MFHKSILCAVAGAALIPAAALAHPGGGGGAGGPGGFGGGMGAGNGMGMGSGMGNGMGLGNGNFGNIGSSMRDEGRLNSQGPANASATGIAHANQNSVLAGTTATNTVTSGALTGLKAGATLYSNGTAVGTVQQIRLTGNGSVAMVIVKGTNGGLYAVPASKLTYTSGVLSTSARLAGINGPTNTSASSQARLNSQGPAHASATGIAHANSHSVLAGAATTGMTPTNASSQARLNSQGPLHASATGIAHANSHSVLASGSAATLSGVSVGMPLLSNGTQVGTVYRVVTANGVIVRVLVQGTNGRIYSLAPSAFVASGGSLTTSAKLRGI